MSAIEAVREERAGVGSNNEVGMSAIALQDRRSLACRVSVVRI